ncbi:hypothetical protein ACVW1A_007157 [Bradyrhizobium sp. LB1.3]
MGRKVRASKEQKRIKPDRLVLALELQKLKRRRASIANIENLWDEVQALREQVRKAETRGLR